MQIEGCKHKHLEGKDRFFDPSYSLSCGNCSLPLHRLGPVVFAGHLYSTAMVADILVWTRPVTCPYCGFINRDVLIPCSDYVIDLNYVLPCAC